MQAHILRLLGRQTCARLIVYSYRYGSSISQMLIANKSLWQSVYFDWL